ncbi:DedA family protein [Cellulomonas fimi]|uniref:DedA family protein n=1 Tax=Cellulomonas fimi TaxID=1708 RepID=UPI002358189B|nr:DedA family protein [Cellulomonas fimi]
MFDDILAPVTDGAVSLMESLGAPGAGLAIAAENLFPPLPSELILPLAGFTASQGDLVLWHVLVWTTTGSLVGALVLYALGAWLGRARLLRVADRLPLVDVTDVHAAESWFARHGHRAVLLGRLVPIVRSLVSVPAGVERMPLARFVVLTTVGSAVWNTALVLAGYLLGEQWHRVEDGVGVLQRLVVLAVVAGLLVWLVRRLAARSRGDRPREGAGW